MDIHQSDTDQSAPGDPQAEQANTHLPLLHSVGGSTDGPIQRLSMLLPITQ